MIKGAIEVAQHSRVAGWIHADHQTLRGKTVLAFVGDRCVGAGEVDGFRQDLLDARLGDGFCGFDFPVRLADGEPVGALIVRLQFSDAALLQASSLIVGRDSDDQWQGPDFGAIQPSRVSWMLEHGMLEQPECDFLRAIHTVGVYERSLRAGKRGAGELAGQRIDPEMVVFDLLGVMMMADLRLTRTVVSALSDIAASVPRSAAPVLAVWSQYRGRISVDERSHLTGTGDNSAAMAVPMVGGIDYSYGPDRLLFVHRNCRFAASSPVPSTGVVLLTAAAIEKTSAVSLVADIRAA